MAGGTAVVYIAVLHKPQREHGLLISIRVEIYKAHSSLIGIRLAVIKIHADRFISIAVRVRNKIFRNKAESVVLLFEHLLLRYKVKYSYSAHIQNRQLIAVSVNSDAVGAFLCFNIAEQYFSVSAVYIISAVLIAISDYISEALQSVKRPVAFHKRSAVKVQIVIHCFRVFARFVVHKHAERHRFAFCYARAHITLIYSVAHIVFLIMTVSVPVCIIKPFAVICNKNIIRYIFRYFGRAFIICGTCVEIKRRITVCRTVASIAHSAYSFHLRLAVEIIYRYTDKLRRIAVFVIYVCLRYKISVGRHCADKFIPCLECDLAVLSDKACSAVLSRQISHITVFHRLNIILSSQQYVHIPVIAGEAAVIVSYYHASAVFAYSGLVFILCQQLTVLVIDIILVIVKAHQPVAVCLCVHELSYALSVCRVIFGKGIIVLGFVEIVSQNRKRPLVHRIYMTAVPVCHSILFPDFILFARIFFTVGTERCNIQLITVFIQIEADGG